MTQAEINLIADFCESFPRLANFKAREFLYLGGSGNGRNSPPARPLHAKVYETSEAAQSVRDAFRSGIKTTSVYRTPAYNASLSGAVRGSYHTKGMAVDLVPINGDVDGLHKAALKARKAGKFTGGIGVYRTFVHIDTRGSAADWDYR